MFVEELRRAVLATPRGRLADLSAAVWKGFAAGAISEDDAQALRKRSRPERRSRWHQHSLDVLEAVHDPRRASSDAARGRQVRGCRLRWLRGFTQAENAALAVIIREIATTGSCGLPAAAIAGRAGVSASSARNAVREARRRGILCVQERRIRHDRKRSEPDHHRQPRAGALGSNSQPGRATGGWGQNRDTDHQPSIS